MKLPYTQTFKTKRNEYRYARVVGKHRSLQNEEFEATYLAACAEVVPVNIEHPTPGFDLANYARQRARHRVRKANITLQKLATLTTRFANSGELA